MRLDNNRNIFFEILKAGLWEKEVLLAPFRMVDYQEVMRLAEEQSVVGLIAAGMEHVTDMKVPKAELLQFVGSTLQIEDRNKAMNHFIRVIVEKLRKEEIDAILVKGQGIAQCYERPLWRTSGDVDLLLDTDCYELAKAFFTKIASSTEQEEYVAKHIGFRVKTWLVELHEHMYFGLSQRAYNVVCEVEKEILHGNGVRVWNNGGVDVYLPSPDNDIIIVFTHFLGHFCFGGIGLRQLCDICRLLWTYKEQINFGLLEKRLREMALMTEWKVFAAVSVDWLGMPIEAMPFYDSSRCYKRRAHRAVLRILRVGDLGMNSEDGSEQKKSEGKASLSKLWYRSGEYLNLMTIFPMDAHRFFINYLIDKMRISRARKRNS